MIPNIQRLIEVAEAARVFLEQVDDSDASEWAWLRPASDKLDKTLAKLDADEGWSVESVAKAIGESERHDPYDGIMFVDPDDAARAALRAIGWEEPK